MNIFGEIIDLTDIISPEKIENAIKIRDTLSNLFHKRKIHNNPEFYNYNINSLEELNKFKEMNK